MSKFPRWTEAEKQRLRDLYAIMPAFEICKILGRSNQGTVLMAAKLGLKADRVIHWRDNWRFLNNNPYDQLTQEERAYIAGVFDGEGSLDKMKGRQFWRFNIGNTHKGLIDYLALKIPYAKVQYGKSRNGWKEKWDIRLFGNRKIKALLQVLMPYLIVKRAKATEVITEIEAQIANV